MRPRSGLVHEGPLTGGLQTVPQVAQWQDWPAAVRPGRMVRVSNNRIDYLLDHPAGHSPTVAAIALLSLPKPHPEPVTMGVQLGRSTQTLTAARAMLRDAPPHVDEGGWIRVVPGILDRRYSPTQQLTWILLRKITANGKTGEWLSDYEFGARSMHRATGKRVSWRSWLMAWRVLHKDLWITPDGMEGVGYVIPSVTRRNSLSNQRNSLSNQRNSLSNQKAIKESNLINNASSPVTEGITTSSPASKPCPGSTPWGSCSLALGRLPECDNCPRIGTTRVTS